MEQGLERMPHTRAKQNGQAVGQVGKRFQNGQFPCRTAGAENT